MTMRVGGGDPGRTERTGEVEGPETGGAEAPGVSRVPDRAAPTASGQARSGGFAGVMLQSALVGHAATGTVEAAATRAAADAAVLGWLVPAGSGALTEVSEALSRSLVAAPSDRWAAIIAALNATPDIERPGITRPVNFPGLRAILEQVPEAERPRLSRQIRALTNLSDERAMMCLINESSASTSLRKTALRAFEKATRNGSMPLQAYIAACAAVAGAGGAGPLPSVDELAHLHIFSAADHARTPPPLGEP